MNVYTGFLKDLTHKYTDPVSYVLPLGDIQINLNELLGKVVTLMFEEEIRCVHCDRKIKKTYNNGYCYPCVISLAETDLCIVKPHICHFSEGTCRDELFAASHCMIPHYVYLSLSSGAKVGITRKGNEQKRWVDQGAIMAIPFAEVPTRKHAGELEVVLAEHVADKTNWRKMLQNDIVEVNLLDLRERLLPFVPDQFRSYLLANETIREFIFPAVEGPPSKINSYDIEKAPFTDHLVAIKGSYLIFTSGVINLKKYKGYKVSITVS